MFRYSIVKCKPVILYFSIGSKNEPQKHFKESLTGFRRLESPTQKKMQRRGKIRKCLKCPISSSTSRFPKVLPTCWSGISNIYRWGHATKMHIISNIY